MLLLFEQVLRLGATAALTSRTGLLGSLERLVKGPDLHEGKLTQGATALAIRTNVVRPDEPAEKIARLHLQLLQAQAQGEVIGGSSRGLALKLYVQRIASRSRPCQAGSQHAKVVRGFSLKAQLLQGRGAGIAFGEDKPQIRPAVGDRLHNQFNALPIGPALGIDQLQHFTA